MIKFPSIEQFRNAIRHAQTRASYVGKDENGDPVYDGNREKPVIKYRGTVKLHGTNAAITYKNGVFGFQSRERELSLQSDNSGFMLYMSNNTEILKEMFNDVFHCDLTKNDCTYVIFGEWCGGNIQKGVALTELQKMFVVFAACTVSDSDEMKTKNWKDNISMINYPEQRIFNSLMFPRFEIVIDFNKPELVQNSLVDMTIGVETECPVSKHFGISGVGEGIVWTPEDVAAYDEGYWFKVKGEKHSASKVKKLAEIDVEAFKQVEEFVESVVSENRLEQGIQNLINEQQKEFEMKNLGDFIRWVVNDVIKEEQDTIVTNQFDSKMINKKVSEVARKWFMNKFNSKG